MVPKASESYVIVVYMISARCGNRVKAQSEASNPKGVSKLYPKEQVRASQEREGMRWSVPGRGARCMKRSERA